MQVQFEHGSARRVVEQLDQPLARYALTLDRAPVRLTVDPDYDVLRYLDPSEQPPSLSQLFGGTTWLVVPVAAPAEELAAWHRLAEAWQGRFPQLKVVDDTQAGSVPAGANRLLLGWDNRALDDALRKTLSGPAATLQADALLAGGQRYARNGAAVVRVATDAKGVSTGFIGAAGAALIDALARKLPHYGSYGVLAFAAAGAQNLYKAVPDNPNSRMSRDLK